MDVLVHLAANPERVVSKEELLTVVWGGAFVEEGALAQAIHSLRKALGDDARQPRFIQTVPKRGYRLVAGLERDDGDHREARVGQTASAPDILPFSMSGIPPEPAPRRWPRQSILVLAGLTVLASSWIVWSRSGVEQPDPPVEQGKTTIAVLPFENLGPSQDEFFADGLTEELTKDLASLRSLRVTSRTSAMLYKGARKSLRDIARELGVDYILEGTVRWETRPAGPPRIRVTPQLIHATDDSHIWATSYSEEIGDIFEVQEEISQRVIDALGITLVPGEAQRARRYQPRNLDAYSAYLRGLDFKSQPFYSQEYLLKAVSMFERAVELDPDFALAWSELSQAHSYLAFNNDGSPDEVEKAKRALEKATTLAPDLPDVRLAQAYFTYRCLQDFDAALKQLSAAAELFPSDAGVFQSLGFVLRRKGRLKEAIGALQTASELNPRSSETVWGIGETYRALRDYELADRYYRKAISLAPDESYFWEEQALNRLAWKGSIDEARAILAQAPIQGSLKLRATAFKLDIYERKYSQALARLSPEEAKELPAPDPSRIAMLTVFALERLGDHNGALVAAEKNRTELETRLAVFPQEALTRAYLAVALAQLGRGTEALAELDQAVRLKRHDAFTGPPISQVYAMVELILGHRREALGRLSSLLFIPYRSSISAAELRLDPFWDPLRTEPGFQELLLAGTQ